MNIEQLASKSGDSQLLNYSFSDGVLQLSMHVPEVSDRVVTIVVPTHCVFTAVPQSASAPHRTCYIELLDVALHTKCNDSGIVIPPDDFGTMMQQVREGLGVVFGSRVSESPYVLRLVAARPLLACPVANVGEIRCQVDTPGSS